MNGASSAAMIAAQHYPGSEGRAAAVTPADRPTLLADYWTLEEMAVQADVSPRTLTRWYGMRMGPPRTRLGHKVLYHIPTARAWLAAQCEDVARRDRGGRAA